MTAIRCTVGVVDGVEVKFGLHRGPSLSPSSFTLVMDMLTCEIRQDAQWSLMFDDEILLINELKEQLQQVEGNSERWRNARDSRGMRVSWSNPEYNMGLCDNSGTILLQNEKWEEVEGCKFRRSTVKSRGDCGNEGKKRVQAG